MEGAENLLDYHARPPSWVVIEGTEQGVVIRDADMSLPWVAITGWKLLLTAVVDGGLVFH